MDGSAQDDPGGFEAHEEPAWERPLRHLLPHPRPQSRDAAVEVVEAEDKDTVHWGVTTEGVTYGGGEALDAETTASATQ